LEIKIVIAIHQNQSLLSKCAFVVELISIRNVNTEGWILQPHYFPGALWCTHSYSLVTKMATAQHA